MRTLADQSWEQYELIDDWGRDTDMPSRGPAGRPPGLLAGASTYFAGMAAARVCRHQRALQRLAHVRATRGAQAARRVPAPCPGGAGRTQQASQARRQTGCRLAVADADASVPGSSPPAAYRK